MTDEKVQEAVIDDLNDGLSVESGQLSVHEANVEGQEKSQGEGGGLMDADAEEDEANKSFDFEEINHERMQQILKEKEVPFELLSGKKEDGCPVGDRPLRSANESKAREEKPGWGMATQKTPSKEKQSATWGRNTNNQESKNGWGGKKEPQESSSFKVWGKENEAAGKKDTVSSSGSGWGSIKDSASCTNSSGGGQGAVTISATGGGGGWESKKSETTKANEGDGGGWGLSVKNNTSSSNSGRGGWGATKENTASTEGNVEGGWGSTKADASSTNEGNSTETSKGWGNSKGGSGSSGWGADKKDVSASGGSEGGWGNNNTNQGSGDNPKRGNGGRGFNNNNNNNNSGGYKKFEEGDRQGGRRFNNNREDGGGGGVGNNNNNSTWKNNNSGSSETGGWKNNTNGSNFAKGNSKESEFSGGWRLAGPGDWASSKDASSGWGSNNKNEGNNSGDNSGGVGVGWKQNGNSNNENSLRSQNGGGWRKNNSNGGESNANGGGSGWKNNNNRDQNGERGNFNNNRSFNRPNNNNNEGNGFGGNEKTILSSSGWGASTGQLQGGDGSGDGGSWGSSTASSGWGNSNSVPASSTTNTNQEVSQSSSGWGNSKPASVPESGSSGGWGGSKSTVDIAGLVTGDGEGWGSSKPAAVQETNNGWGNSKANNATQNQGDGWNSQQTKSENSKAKTNAQGGTWGGSKETQGKDENTWNSSKPSTESTQASNLSKSNHENTANIQDKNSQANSWNSSTQPSFESLASNNSLRINGKRSSDPRQQQSSNEEKKIKDKIEQMSEVEIEERAFGTKRRKLNEEVEGERGGDDSQKEQLLTDASIPINLENKTTDEEIEQIGKFSPEDNRTDHPAGIDIDIKDLDGEDDVIVLKKHQGNSSIAQLCSSSIHDGQSVLPPPDEINEEFYEEGQGTHKDPQKLRNSIIKTYQMYSQFFTNYKQYICPKGEYLILQDTPLQTKQVYQLLNDKLQFQLPGQIKKYNLLIQFNTLMPYSEFRYLPLITLRNKQNHQELGFLSYDVSMEMIKNIQLQETKDNRTIFPCWVESVVPSTHKTLNVLADYLLEKNLIAGFNFTNHATINLMHVRQLFPDLEYIDLPDESENKRTSLVAINTLEAGIYEGFCRKIEAYSAE